MDIHRFTINHESCCFGQIVVYIPFDAVAVERFNRHSRLAFDDHDMLLGKRILIPVQQLRRRTGTGRLLRILRFESVGGEILDRLQPIFGEDERIPQESNSLPSRVTVMTEDRESVEPEETEPLVPMP